MQYSVENMTSLTSKASLPMIWQGGHVSVSGQLLGNDGLPLEGVMVDITTSQGQVASVQTTKGGLYAALVKALEEGELTIYASYAGDGSNAFAQASTDITVSPWAYGLYFGVPIGGILGSGAAIWWYLKRKKKD